MEFDENKGTFLTPRGRYTLTLYDTYLRMHGTRYDYQIKYDDISRLFLLPKPDDVHMAFVIALDKPIRQGQQRYQMLVLQTNREMDEVTVNLDEKTLKDEYKGDLDPVMQGSLCNLIAKTFKVISKKKVFVPGKFENAYGKACVKCALRASEGFLYPLEKSFVFIHKPPVLIRFDEVDSVEFQRYAGGQGSTRNFDLSVKLKKSSGESSAKEYVFSGIDRSDFDCLFNFLSGKKITIINTQDALGEQQNAAYTLAVENDMDDESSDDEDFGSDDESSSSEDMSDEDDDVEMVPEDEDSDLEEARERGKKEKKRERDLEDEGVSKKKKKKEKSSKVTAKSPKKKKKKKDPNAPKRPATAFLFYSNAMRSKVKEENPDMSFGDIQKTIGAKYKELSEDDKAKYDEMAYEDKKRYEREMKGYTPPSDSDSESDSDGEQKKKGKSKKKKDKNAPKKGLSAYMFFVKENRAKIKEDNPELDFGAIGKLVGQKYKELSEEDRKPYDEMAEKDKERYESEMKAYKAKKTSEKNGDPEEESD